MDFSRVRNIFFDFDGTVGDSYGPVTDSFNAVFRHFARPEVSADEVRPFVGIGLEVTLTRYLGEENLDEAVGVFRRHYLSHYKEGSQLMPGAREMLDALDGKYRMALCSNKPGETLRNLCDHLDISRSFDVILGAYDVPELKPHPAMLEEAMRRLEATPGDSLYVGDTTVDVEFARTCDLPYVLVLGGTGTREELAATNPVALLEDIAELPTLLGVRTETGP
ncbi:MAG TPA: HAD family hydrolase [Planctomycetota bacterium]|nr:HAD family hydrolase [Planctomycetota bacterium]